MEHLDDTSINIFAAIILHCMASGCTPLELFEQVIVQMEDDASQEVIKAESFYKVLVENRIKDSMEPHPNLHKMLQLNSNSPDTFSLKNIALVL